MWYTDGGVLSTSCIQEKKKRRRRRYDKGKAEERKGQKTNMPKRNRTVGQEHDVNNFDL